MGIMKILVVEDDRLLNTTLCYNLEVSGYQVEKAYTIEEAIRKLDKCTYALVILDVNLPDGKGDEICRYMKDRYPQTAIVFLTANDLEDDVINGYDLGADDYVTKPFSVSILLKKIAAILKRQSLQGEAKNQENYYDDGKLALDFAGLKGTLFGESITLTSNEYRVLYILTQNPNIVLTRRILMEKLWDIDENFVDEHALTATISRVRGKIQKKGYQGIKTVYGMGYMWMGS